MGGDIVGRATEGAGHLPAAGRQGNDMTRTSGVAGLLLACVPAIGAAQGYGLGEPAAIAPAAIDARDIAVGDLDGDGLDDVLVLSTTQSPRERIVRLYARTPNGFATPLVIDQAADESSHMALRSLKLADIDGDGDLDILLLSRGNVTSSLVVLRNDGDGYTRATQPVPQMVDDFHVVDVDGDGAADVLATRRHADTPVLLGDGEGGFVETGTIDLVSGGTVPSFGDIDGDGLGDLVYTAMNAVWVRRHGGDGYVAAAERLFPLHQVSELQAWAFGDFDGNGLPDIAMRHFNRRGGTDLVLHPQVAPGGFRGAIRIGSLVGTDDVHAVDLDGNGIPDLLVHPGFNEGPLAAYLSAHRRLQGRLDFGIRFNGVFSYGDLDGDGITDVVVRELSGAVTWVPGVGQPRGVDLGVTARVAPSAVVVDVRNAGTATGSGGSGGIGVSLASRTGAVTFDPPQVGCMLQRPDYMTCSFAVPAPGTTLALSLPISLAAGSSRELVTVRATVSTVGDTDAGNNEVIARGTVTAPPP